MTIQLNFPNYKLIITYAWYALCLIFFFDRNTLLLD